MKTRIKFQLKERGKGKPTRTLPKSLEQRIEELPTAAGVVLALIGIAGLTTMILFAPNALLIFGAFLKKKHGRRFSNKEVEEKLLQTVYYLKKTGKIQIGQDKESIWLKLGRLTKTNQKQLELDSLVVPKPNTWDKTYWLVAADIPSKTHRLAADAFRRKLLRLHFYPLQRTLWLYPYNPKEQLQALIEYFDISRFVTLMHISELDKDDIKRATTFWKEHNVL